MNTWIKCDGYKNLPIGEWLVLLDEPHTRGKIQTCDVHPNVTIIGNQMAFDMKPVIAYMALPSTNLD